MSDKSGVASHIISLPKGGGALQGLGEKFSPDLHTGTGNLSVPIAVPAGRNGFQPQLSLAYSTGSGNGPFGLGWTLSVPGVTRRTAKGVPRYEEEGDVYVLSGAEDLVAVGGRFPGRMRYQPRTEGLFALIERQLDATNDFWEVCDKDGRVSTYGTPGRRGDDAAALSRPDDATRVFSWRLTETRDPFGNRIVYEYRWDEGDGDGHRWRQPLLDRIRYVDYTDGGETRFLVSVTFVYDDEPYPDDPMARAPRPDSFSDHRAGFEIRTTRRCTWIVTATHAERERLVRGYRLVYLDERADLPDLSERLPPNSVSLLSQIHVLGYADPDEVGGETGAAAHGRAVTELPPVEFAYSTFAPRTRRDFFPLTGPDLPAGSLGQSEYELADLTGNGLPDIVEMNGAVRYWENAGDGRFELPRSFAEAPAGLSLADPGVQLIDADGDGRIDLLVTSGGLNGYFPLQHDGGWDQRSFRAYASAPSFALDDPEVRLVDLDGDGVTDALRTGTRLEHYFNHPEKGWHEVHVAARRPLEEFPDVAFSDPHVKLADMTGDGLQDLALVSDGNVEYWPNLGHGAWGPRISMRGGPRLPYWYDPRRVLLGDVDGDGLADLVYVDGTEVTLWINQSGNAWSEPIAITGTPPVTDTDAVRLVDLRGSGVSGILWSADQDPLGRPRSFFLDLTGGGKPYLLDRVDNHLGAITEVRYASSTIHWLADRDGPSRWRTSLPFPVQVVASLHVTDVFSATRLMSEFRYHHGHWDGGEREFRGFGMVEQLDAEASTTTGLDGGRRSAPTCLKTWFHLGPIGPEQGEWFEADPRLEYWEGDTPCFPQHPDLDTLMNDNDLPRRAKRDAIRSLRGHALRTELYALDGSSRQERPYIVTESWLSVREEPVPFAGEVERSRIFFAMLRGQRTTQWERGSDPQTRFTFNDDHDRYGQPCLQTDIACPRGWRTLADRPGQRYLGTRSRTTFAEPVGAGRYIHDRVASVTTREIVDDGHATIDELLTLRDSSLPVIGQTLNFYDLDPDVTDARVFAESLGSLGDFGSVARTERLALTDALLEAVYGNERPPYLAGPIDLAAIDCPAEFLTQLSQQAGYVDRRSGNGATVEPGLFVVADQRRYDVHDDATPRGHGLVVTTLDPLGHRTGIVYDEPYRMLPARVTDPAGNVTMAIHDYRTLQPRRVTDCNGNHTLMTFTPLGLPESIRLVGRRGDGDQGRPSVRFRYDLRAYETSPSDRRQPVFVATTRHVHRDTDTDVPMPARDDVIESRQYSDGFGRVIQTRTRGEDVRFGSTAFGGGDEVLLADQTSDPTVAIIGRTNPDGERPNVVVSGWQLYDDRGRVVEKYEPFFSVGWEFLPPSDGERGQSARIVYDPLGRVIRTINADGSEQRVISGVPLTLEEPEHFEPTPWETYTYDANDNGERTHAEATATYRHCWNTPSSAVLDSLGRTVVQVHRNGPTPGTDWFTHRFVLDIRGNLLTIIDALGRRAFTEVYDRLDRRLRVDSIDGGTRIGVLDAAGNAVEGHDGKGARSFRSFDHLNRLTHLWARDTLGEAVTFRERLFYGDDPTAGLTPAAVDLGNLRGRLYRHYDEAGRLTTSAYDLNGNALEVVREVIDAAQVLGVFAAGTDWSVTPYRVDWQSGSGTSAVDLARRAVELFDATSYRMTFTYNALNHTKTMQYPADGRGRRSVYRPTYNRAGALERVDVDGEACVERIAYNAKGQRVLVALGNRVMTRFAYHPTTFRLVHVRTESYESAGPLSYRPTGGILQDFGYRHDLVGNVLTIQDRAPRSRPGGLSGTFDRRFTYDPLYRLRSATGRECDMPTPAPPWDDSIRCIDATRTRSYVQEYAYDPSGNLTVLKHTAADGDFRRAFSLVPGTNRLAMLTVGRSTYTYDYDPVGNLTGENLERRFEWDHADRLRVFRVQTPASGAADGSAHVAEPSVYAHYLYGAAGQRVMKIVRFQGGATHVTVYIGATFEHYSWTQAGRHRQSTRRHVMDGEGRIAILRDGDRHPHDRGPDVEYHLGDHIGNSQVVVGGATRAARDFIAREEYFPYGETSFGSFSQKRYRFTGKERDEESGLTYFGARYYASWLGRWTSCDPIGAAGGLNLYRFASDSPIARRDQNGMQDARADQVHQSRPTFEPGISAVGSQSYYDNIAGANLPPSSVPEASAEGPGFLERLMADLAMDSLWPRTRIRAQRPAVPDVVEGGASFEQMMEKVDLRNAQRVHNFGSGVRFFENQVLAVEGMLADFGWGAAAALLATRVATRAVPHIGATRIVDAANPVNPDDARRELCVPSVAAFIRNRDEHMGLDWESYYTAREVMEEIGWDVSRHGSPLSTNATARDFVRKSTKYAVSDTHVNFEEATGHGHYLIILRGEEGGHALYGGIAPNGSKFVFDPSSWVEVPLEDLPAHQAYKLYRPR
jgi:RHS repeat-associated protein